MRKFILPMLLSCLSISTSSSQIDINTPDKPSTFTFHGQTIKDPYSWLEEVQSNQTLNWAKQQNDFTEAHLGKTQVDNTAKNILKFSAFQTYRAFNRIDDNSFYLKGWSGTTTAALFVESTKTGKTRRIAGPDLTGKNQNDKQLEFVSRFWPSRHGRYVVVMENKMGARWGLLKVIEVASGKLIKTFESGIFVGLSQVSWSQKDQRFLLTRFDKTSSGSPHNVRLESFDLNSHKSRIEYQPNDKQKQLILSPAMLRDSNQYVVHIRNGSDATNKALLLDLDNPDKAPLWLFDKADANRLLLGSRQKQLWFYSDENAKNGQVIRLNLDTPTKREVIVKQTRQAISANSSVGGNAIGMFGDTIALTYLDGGRYTVRGFNGEGKKRFSFDVPDSGSIWGGFNGTPSQDAFYFGFIGVDQPSSIYQVNSNGKRRLVKSAELPFDIPITAKRVYVDTAPGIKVPVLIAHRKGLDLTTAKPAIFYAYGGFGWVSFMWYQPHLMEWFERDGIYVIAGIRGGGEYGTQWHQAGIKHNRQNAIDDYNAVSRWLIEQNYSNNKLLIANGGSFSGSLIAAATLQAPELYAMALIDFPVIDMLRYTEFGHAKYWQSDLGDPQIKADFDVLATYSPYHRLLDGQCPPPTLVRTGQYDKTTTPMHGYKYVAAGQRNKNCRAEVILDVMEGAGHNFGTTPQQMSKSHAIGLTFIQSRLPD